jgi:hypothetical protein
VLDPKVDPGYMTYYQQYTADRGLTRKHDVQQQFTTEEHLRMGRSAYGRGEALMMLLISLSIAVVSRGDEVRGVKPAKMRLKKIDAIGELCTTKVCDAMLSKCRSVAIRIGCLSFPAACR